MECFSIDFLWWVDQEKYFKNDLKYIIFEAVEI